MLFLWVEQLQRYIKVKQNSLESHRIFSDRLPPLLFGFCDFKSLREPKLSVFPLALSVDHDTHSHQSQNGQSEEHQEHGVHLTALWWSIFTCTKIQTKLIMRKRVLCKIYSVLNRQFWALTCDSFNDVRNIEISAGGQRSEERRHIRGALETLIRLLITLTVVNF